MGIGDFYLYGGDPTERLHVRDGRVRIQELPDNPAADNLTRFMVVDDTPGAEYGVVKWRTLPVIPPPAPSCEWTLLNNGVSGPAIPHHVYSAVGVSDACPDASDAVGIGVNLSSTAPTAKLTVATTTFATGASISATTAAGNTVGLAVAATGGGASVRGVQAITNGTSTNGVAHAGDFISFDASNYAIGAYGAAYAGNFNAGFRGVSFSNGMSNFGVLGESRSNGLINVGVYASQGTGSFASPVAGNYGLFATTHNPSTGWAGWFQGDVMINGNGFLTGMIPILSDASLKTNVQAITDASQLLVQLQPKTYDFLVAEHPEIALSLEPQIGFIAQEVEQVLPQLVKQVTIPATLDSTGAELTASEDIKALNYIGIIPLLVAGYQEQQATIAQMQAQLDQCCAANPGMAPGGDGSLKSAPAKEDVQEQRLVIHPNPFTDHTTLSYYVPQAG
ncbi:MAG: tail fiber domain-containing protein, partial [Flavobacteriales bacterium]|nr:tail fiber domain-containing protein [Flavobacteriales bacterium]